MNGHDPGGSYDAVAEEYASRISAELARKPFDRALLEQFAQSVRAGGIVADLGCGPGHVGRYIADRGVRTFGLDLSHEMVSIARRGNLDGRFVRGDLAALPFREASLAGLIAFYSIIHIPRANVVEVLCDCARVLERGAPLLLAFHIGDEVVHLDEWWKRQVSVDFFFYRPEEMRGWLRAAGFTKIDVMEREPYGEDVEHQSRRCYIVASVAD